MKLKNYLKNSPEIRLSDNSAVSPVIGVMLMLVVTIIIAAFVAAFAGGAADSASVAPSASFDVNILSGQGAAKDQYVMLVKHLGGESIPSGDLQIISYYTSSDGKQVLSGAIGRTTQAIAAGQIAENAVRIPYLTDIAIGSTGEDGTNFGEYTFKAGDVISTGNSKGTAVAVFGTLTSQVGTVNADTYKNYGFKKGSKVEVEIIHTPSQKSIYKKQVTVV